MRIVPSKRLVASISCGLLVGMSMSSCDAPDTDKRVATEPFVVASGSDGVALTNGRWLEKVFEPAENEGWSPGPLAVPLSGGAAAAVYGGRMAVVRPHTAAVVKECVGCSGVAVTGQEIVTTRQNLQPGNAFDLVFFSRDLSRSRSVPAERLAERVTTDYPQENTESPTTVAAGPDRVTVTYLSREGGVRRGPSIIAQYSFDGRLLDTTQVDGVIMTSAVSPDGGYLAIGVGGSGGWCVTSSDLTVIDLAGLEVLDLGPALPDTFAGDPGTSWSFITDLVWRGGAVTATGLLYDPEGGETCDFDPEPWTRTVDPVANDVLDDEGPGELATRWVGPACGDVLAVVRTSGGEGGEASSDALIARIGGIESRLGAYTRLAPDGPTAGSCP